MKPKFDIRALSIRCYYSEVSITSIPFRICFRRIHIFCDFSGTSLRKAIVVSVEGVGFHSGNGGPQEPMIVLPHDLYTILL